MMLAMVAVPDSILLVAVAFAMWVEVVVAERTLLALGVDVRGLIGRLIIVQLVTWIPFVSALVALRVSPDAPRLGWVFGLTLIVVAFEVALIRGASQSMFRQPALPSAGMGIRPALLASVAGNFASILMSFLVTALAVSLMTQG